MVNARSGSKLVTLDLESYFRIFAAQVILRMATPSNFITDMEWRQYLLIFYWCIIIKFEGYQPSGPPACNVLSI